jgi:hypothetical protein
MHSLRHDVDSHTLAVMVTRPQSARMERHHRSSWNLFELNIDPRIVPLQRPPSLQYASSAGRARTSRRARGAPQARIALADLLGELSTGVHLWN